MLIQLFFIPKKDKTVRWVSNFRQLNQMLRQRVYPLPKIQDALHWRPGYKYFIKIDLSMRNYTFELNEESKNMSVIVTPLGKFRNKQLPMGVSQPPDLCLPGNYGKYSSRYPRSGSIFGWYWNFH
jgi:hypothetical protein